MLRWIKTFLIAVVPICSAGQITVKGKIIDVITDNPVPYATVYIDGTTHGTITDSAGLFSLERVALPCQIVFGHTSYFSQSFSAGQDYLPDSIIFLTPKDIGMDEVVVSAKFTDLREKNMKLFKQKFLGEDRWGLQAIIENEEVLRFVWQYDTLKVTSAMKKKIKELGLDFDSFERIEGKTDLYRVPLRFSASAANPLKIVLPLTGYRLTYDLQEFSIDFSSELNFVYWKYRGFSLYEAVEPKSNTELFKFKRNRLNVYYNSPMHLLRAMYSKSLRQNGYEVVELGEGNTRLKPLGSDTWIRETNTLTIPGNKGKNFYVMYYSNLNGEPTNLNQSPGISPVQSQIYFMSDSCLIRENGTLVNNDILFRPFMGTKQIGASLPSDFKPGPGRL